ncbi:MAG: ATP synthase F1 subunit gamma [Candidatus Liptonbacteria bacterium]|nr:ATP synthase F1 subunit gamma [Candidatus Liptonbacteria bacterium]
MAGLKQIKTKIRSIDKTRTVTKAMEAVSAAKMRKAQMRAIAGRPYARAAAAILSRVSGSKGLENHPLTGIREIKKALYIVITSDKGLAGALNSAVLRSALADIVKSKLPAPSVSVIAVGRKANDFFTARGFDVEAFHLNTDEITSGFVHELVEEAAIRFENGAIDQVKIAYQNFRSTFDQLPTLRVLFPLSLGELEKVIHDILPARGAFSEIKNGSYPKVYEVEPSEEEVLGAVLKRLAGIFVYHALIESQASEHSARMVAMKSASDKAEEMEHDLTLQFNKARQASITREVSEVTGGMEAMAL